MLDSEVMASCSIVSGNFRTSERRIPKLPFGNPGLGMVFGISSESRWTSSPSSISSETHPPSPFRLVSVPDASVQAHSRLVQNPITCWIQLQQFPQWNSETGLICFWIELLYEEKFQIVYPIMLLRKAKGQELRHWCNKGAGTCGACDGCILKGQMCDSLRGHMASQSQVLAICRLKATCCIEDLSFTISGGTTITSPIIV